jgi:hypothetical protein
MTSNPNRLVRTLLVDKNGVLTTRLMRSGTIPIAKDRFTTPALPPAPVAADMNDQFLYLVHGPHAGDWERKLASFIREDDEATIPLAVELLTTGNDLAQRHVSNVLDEAIQTMGDAYAESNSDYQWQQSCPDSFSPVIKQKMLAAWHVGNFIEEAEVATNHMDVQGRVMRYDMILNIDDLDGDRSENTSYWRGLAVLAIINPPLKDKGSYLRGFVTWAAEHPDPRRVIDIVRERGTLNVDVLASLMNEQNGTVTSLRSGSL